ncbi:MAG: hypothetical protein HKN23_07590, partial [Verrucomicrobiales bacterium]|nr:hypothetical protein [Verrucomicrobiales bacterium]
IKQKYPIVRFSGAGTIHFVGAADTRAEDFDYDPPGLPSGFDLETSLTTTGGERSGFQNRGHRRKFIVFGTKVSHRVLP